MVSPAIDAERTFEKTQQSFRIFKKDSQETRNRRNLPQSDKENLLKTYRLNTLPNLGKGQECLPLPVLCNIRLKVLESAITGQVRQKRRTNRRTTVLLCR